MEIKIAIQGIKGSFHHQVAEEYFHQEFDLALIYCFNYCSYFQLTDYIC